MAISELPLASVSERVFCETIHTIKFVYSLIFMQIKCIFCTKSRFQEEAQGNPQMAYCPLLSSAMFLVSEPRGMLRSTFVVVTNVKDHRIFRLIKVLCHYENNVSKKNSK